MKPIFTSDRRVRIIQYALFGVFIFHFTAVLHAEDLLVWALGVTPTLTRQYLLAHPQFIGGITTLLFLPVFIWTNERWKWVSRFGSNLRQFTVIFLTFFCLGIIIPADEQKTLERQTARLFAIGLKDKAFKVGSNYPFTTANLQALRLQSLGTNSRIGNHLFEQPLHYYNAQQRHTALQQLSHPVTQGGLNYAEQPTRIQPEQLFISALLEGNLTLFARELPNYYFKQLPPSQVPLFYRQALLLYMRLNTRPIINFAEDATEANYRDFMEQQRKLRLQYPPTGNEPYSISEKNKMSFFFGNTYWYYYFYEVPHS